MKTLKEFILIGLVGAVVALTFNTLREDGLSLRAEDLTSIRAAGADTLEIRAPHKLAVIGFEEAEALHRKELAFFVDARSVEKYNQGHVPGSISIPVDAYRRNERSLSTPKGFTVVVYCDGIECELSHDLAKLLVRDGFWKVRVYGGGFEEWDAMGMPLESVEP